MNKRIVAAVLGAAALVIPTAAAADAGHGKSIDKKPAKQVAKGKGQGKKVTFVFKGTFTAPGTVTVTSGNAHVRKGGFVGQAVTFDLAAAKVVVADTNSDQKLDVTDVKDDDVVLVQARIVKGTKYIAPAGDETAATIAARKMIDTSNPPVVDDETEPAPTVVP